MADRQREMLLDWLKKDNKMDYLQLKSSKTEQIGMAEQGLPSGRTPKEEALS